jgi:predicted nuclease of predicted toxin-antitoxin system
MILKPPEEFSFLVDVNLPKWFSFFNDKKFTHVVDINPYMRDGEIWEYALKYNKVILTKDTDFYNMSISSLVKPKIIYFQLGNMTIAELHQYFELNWKILLKHLPNASLIIAWRDNIKVII